MSGSQLTPAPIEPEKSWFSRHLVVTILIGLVVVALGFVAALLFGVMALLKSSDVYREALAQARKSPAVVEALGEPVKAGWFMTGNINVSGPSGHADIAIPISGPKGAGTVYALADKQAGEWHFQRLEVGIDGRPQRISLIRLRPVDIQEQ